jgi:hypothetical protein
MDRREILPIERGEGFGVAAGAFDEGCFVGRLHYIVSGQE